MRKVAFIFFILMLLASSCKKGKDIEAGTTTIPEETTDLTSSANKYRTGSTSQPDTVLPSTDPNNPVGGNINSKDPIAYADKEFLQEIVDYNSLEAIDPPQGWPELLDNSFRIEYNSGELRMIQPNILFSMIEHLDIPREFEADYLYLKDCSFKIIGLFPQKVGSETYLRAIYNYEDKIPDYLARYNILKNDSVGSFKDLTIQRLYKYNRNGLELILDYYLNNYAFDDAVVLMNMHPETDDDIHSYIFKIRGNIFIKNNEKLIVTNIIDDKKEESPSDSCTRMVTEVYSLGSVRESYFTNKPRGLKNDTGYLDSELEIIHSDSINLKGMKAGCLVSNNEPFRYTFDKLIDGNPGTSYVENSPSDLFAIVLGMGKRSTIKAISIINGYALNEQLYFDNNRVKQCKITLSSYKQHQEYVFNLKETMEAQIFAFQPPSFGSIQIEVTEIYQGRKWNDTCLAEINVLTDTGWIF